MVSQPSLPIEWGAVIGLLSSLLLGGAELPGVCEALGAQAINLDPILHRENLTAGDRVKEEQGPLRSAD